MTYVVHIVLDTILAIDGSVQNLWPISIAVYCCQYTRFKIISRSAYLN